MVLAVTVTVGEQKTAESAIVQWVALLFYGGLGITSIWLLFGLKRGYPSAWTVQMILSIVGLIMFPLVTIISILILVNWFKPDTKAWFSIR